MEITRAIYGKSPARPPGAEKFMLDGRHTGTGGGNHIVLGGRRRRTCRSSDGPIWLGSPIRYWQNHPAFSYIFLRPFIGSDSQAPRTTPARRTMRSYELEIALTRCQRSARAAAAPGWWTGCCAICWIDLGQHASHRDLHRQVLFAGRPGLAARPRRVLRVFEMPPHAEMSPA